MKELVDLIASRFISRSDVYAEQNHDGSYRPVHAPITRSVIENHLNCNATYGHYIVNGSQTKLFCFDVDLATEGEFYIEPDLSLVPPEYDEVKFDKWYHDNKQGPFPANLRELWKSRDPASRPFIKERLRTIGEILTSHIHDLGIDTCMTYSGNKGIHVYGLTGLGVAGDIREIGQHIISETGIFLPGRGANFYMGDDQFNGFELELFPKQSVVEDGHFGNLLRMEFGTNRKSPKDPCFLVNQTLAYSQLAPHPNPVSVLRSGNPWRNYE